VVVLVLYMGITAVVLMEIVMEVEVPTVEEV
jgi:hypothetical protein